ncbi:hypothetical protein BN59_02342 [Legionella massiliensis]|uniref:Uncharacterized protein n=1 Tax=Legionella massiliensis TaxID=1034943 RepID=A0A078KUB9_9GAMM|nr:hypothetical protein [Legionella massiliensis]CDZ78045.1 hypothetical protein BN59_02342 [Legionella massiliensis]CEE13783.1 hypothetical protein BN1094_02342 [Legionella massiliensis]
MKKSQSQFFVISNEPVVVNKKLIDELICWMILCKAACDSQLEKRTADCELKAASERFEIRIEALRKIKTNCPISMAELTLLMQFGKLAESPAIANYPNVYRPH